MKLNDKSKHPEWGTKFDNLCYIDKKTTKLVIGTMPPYDICKQSKGKISLDNFFYCSKDNWFWRIVDSLINKNYENYVKDFCKEYNVIRIKMVISLRVMRIYYLLKKLSY